MTTPTQLSLNWLRDQGWLAEVVERWVPATNTRRDLFGMLDIVALRGAETLGVQTTSHTNALARANKINDIDHAIQLDALREAGWGIVVHGWRKSTRDGHACTHGKARCGCRWVLHRYIDLTAPDTVTPLA